MREIFTDKSFINRKKLLAAKLLLIIALFVFFAPLIILPFFNHPCADDYICGYQLKEKGFWAYQSFIYQHWGGRFAATFTGSLFALNNYLYDHYYMHSILLLIMNFFSILFLLNTVITYILKDNSLRKDTILISSIFLAVTICIYPQPSTFIFWFSSAITYHVPIIFMQLEIALFILLFNSVSKSIKISCMILLPILFFIVNGFNELFIIVQCLLIFSMIFLKLYRKVSPAFFTILFLAFISSALIVIFSPGNFQRNAIIEPKGIFVGAAAVSFHSVETIWNILRQPLFWFIALIIFYYGNLIKDKFKKYYFIQSLQNKQLLLPFSILFFLITVISLAVAGLKGGIVPDRYINVVTYCLLVLLLLYAFLSGILTPAILKNTLGLNYKTGIIIYGMLFTGLLCNSLIPEAYKSIIVAPVYDKIIKEREFALEMAEKDKSPAIIKDYTTALQDHLQKEYLHSTVTLQQLIQQKPALLFFEDDLSSAYSISMLGKFYGLDSIRVNKY